MKEWEKDSELVYWVTKEVILQQIRNERQYSSTFVNLKRTIFNNRQILYNNPTKDEDRINVNLCFQIMQKLLAVYYTDEAEVTYATDDVWNDEIAENMTNVYKHDLVLTEMDIKKYLIQFNRFRYGVWLRIMTGYDHIRLCNIFEIINPRCRVPDPDGSVVLNNFRRHWFEMTADLNILKSDDSFENLECLENASNRATDATNKIADQQHRWLNQVVEWSDSNKKPIYNHFTSIYDKEGKVNRKFMFTTDDAMTEIIRKVEIEPVLPEEIENPELCEFPVIINAAYPVDWDPFGVCVPDVMEDKQKYANIFSNLIAIKTSRMALGNDRLYDTRLIKNRADLEKPSKWGRYIGVDPGETNMPIQNAIWEVPQDSISPEVFAMPDRMRMDAQTDVWLSDQTMWVMPDRPVTKWEAQIAQMNTNISMMLPNTVNNRWEKKFARWVYRGYMEYFPVNKDKVIKINQWFGEQSIILSKKDFVSSLTPYITVLQKSDVDSLNEKNKANFMAIEPMLQQNPNIPRISKLFATRKLMKMNWLTKWEISTMVPQTPEEMDAMQQVELLNRDMPVEIWSLDEDHMTYLVIYQRAYNTDAKMMAIEMRKQAYIESGQAQKQMEQSQAMWQWWAANAAGAQLTSNAIAQWNANNSSGPAPINR